MTDPASTTYEGLLVERKGNGVLLVTLNRPEVLNAMTHGMHAGIRRLFKQVADDPLTKVVVVTGAGRGFCAGADLKQPPRNSPAEKIAMFENITSLAHAIIALDKPVISAINGVAVGAGAVLALMADITIAAEDARLIDGQVRVGAVAGENACMLWPLLCGMAKTKYYLLTSDQVTGKEAERIGLVTMAVPTEEVLDRALEVADRLACGSQQAIRWTKRVLNQWLRQANAIFEESAALEVLSFFGSDPEEARRAFMEKRDADFPSARLPVGAT